MDGKPYHKMPLSSWMVPGGNSEQKYNFMKAQKYPMRSAIVKNLGGPLSDVFFSSLSPSQQDQVGVAPRLLGPGRDLWVSPSDILRGHVVVSPPYTDRLLRALTHKGIMDMGAEYESKVHKKYIQEIEEALKMKEIEMRQKAEIMVMEAVEEARQVQQLAYNDMMEKTSSDLIKTYQEVLADCIAQILEEGRKRLQNTVNQAKKKMEEEIDLALKNQSDKLNKQFKFQQNCRDNVLQEKYENQLRRLSENCSTALEKVERECMVNMKKLAARQEAEHITDMVMQACERSQTYHDEKKQMVRDFGTWYTRNYDNEIVQRDYTILELEGRLRTLTKKHERRGNQLKELLRHFQKFINFALKEKPGQAEFLLSVMDCLKELETKEEKEIEQVARMIIDFILKVIEDVKCKQHIQHEEDNNPVQYTVDNFREKLRNKNANLLKVVGEDNKGTLHRGRFQKQELESMVNFCKENQSVVPLLNNTVFE